MGTETMQRVWTFVLTGEVRSGAGAILSGINNRGGAVCHADLFHASATQRRAAHEAYFGPTADPDRMPEWYVEGTTNPWQYINHVVLHPQNGETSVGFYMPYQSVRRLELYDLFEEKAREGGFSVIHVIRNPVACFVSLKQAEQSGIWTRARKSGGQARFPMPVRVNPAELVAFCREHGATLSKIRAACEDRLEISYRDMVLDYQGVMRKVFDHIELPEAPLLAQPSCERLRNRAFEQRVTNWTEIRLEVPKEVKALIDAEDLF